MHTHYPVPRNVTSKASEVNKDARKSVESSELMFLFVHDAADIRS
jgi:hypothetical protein